MADHRRQAPMTLSEVRRHNDLSENIMTAKELPDRFYLEHLDQIDVVGPDGQLIRGDEYFKRYPADNGRAARAPFMVKLDSQQIELMGRAALECRLIQRGFEVARPHRDKGIDLIAFLNAPDHFAAVPLQMKASTGTAFDIDPRWKKVPNLVFAFVWKAQSVNPVIFLLTYQEIECLIPEGRRGDRWRWPQAPKVVARDLEKYKDRWEWLRIRLGSVSQPI